MKAVRVKTDECEEADALRARAPAAQEADGDDDASDDDQYQRDVIEHEDRVRRVVTQQHGVDERLTVDVDPHSDSEHHPACHLHDHHHAT